MSISEIKNRKSILEAIKEYDILGEEGFLSKYGFGKSRRYFLKYNNRLYDSKAIVGVAYGIEFPTEGFLKPEEFSGGFNTVQKLLEQLGFEVVVFSLSNSKSQYDFHIGIFSFLIDNDNPRNTSKNLSDILSILNSYNEFDLIITPGFSLYDSNDLQKLLEENKNKNSLLNVEVWFPEDEDKALNYFIKGNTIIKKDIKQLFGTSKQMNGNRLLMEKFLSEFETNRSIKVKDKTLRLLICGEINVVKNNQAHNNEVAFRLGLESALNNKFNNIFTTTDIFIDPTHSQMGNQGKLEMRRKYFSKNKKVFCSTSNFEISQYLDKYNLSESHIDAKQKLLQKSLQYCFYDSNQIDGKVVFHNNHTIFKEYVIQKYFKR
jgi:hypothetical protein